MYTNEIVNVVQIRKLNIAPNKQNMKSNKCFFFLDLETICMSMMIINIIVTQHFTSNIVHIIEIMR